MRGSCAAGLPSVPFHGNAAFSGHRLIDCNRDNDKSICKFRKEKDMYCCPAIELN